MTDQPINCEQWFSLIEEHKKSNLTQKEFCKEKNLSLVKFGYYLQKYRKKDLATQTPLFSQVIVQSKTNINKNEIKIELPNGFRCQVVADIQPEQLRKILGAMLTC